MYMGIFWCGHDSAINKIVSNMQVFKVKCESIQWKLSCEKTVPIKKQKQTALKRLKPIIKKHHLWTS